MRKRTQHLKTLALRWGVHSTDHLDREFLGLAVVLALVILGHALR